MNRRTFLGAILGLSAAKPLGVTADRTYTIPGATYVSPPMQIDVTGVGLPDLPEGWNRLYDRGELVDWWPPNEYFKGCAFYINTPTVTVVE